MEYAQQEGMAIFPLNSKVNTRNVVKNAEDHYVDFSHGADKVMDWVGLTGLILGPHFIRGRISVNTFVLYRYHVVQRDLQNVERNDLWWQRDDAPAHTSNATIRYLTGQFPGRLMSKGGDWSWPQRSPDLAACDFFLWGYLKHNIWNVPVIEQPKILRELRNAIQR